MSQILDYIKNNPYTIFGGSFSLIILVIAILGLVGYFKVKSARNNKEPIPAVWEKITEVSMIIFLILGMLLTLFACSKTNNCFFLYLLLMHR